MTLRNAPATGRGKVKVVRAEKFCKRLPMLMLPSARVQPVAEELSRLLDEQE